MIRGYKGAMLVFVGRLTRAINRVPGQKQATFYEHVQHETRVEERDSCEDDLHAGLGEVWAQFSGSMSTRDLHI